VLARGLGAAPVTSGWVSIGAERIRIAWCRADRNRPRRSPPTIRAPRALWGEPVRNSALRAEPVAAEWVHLQEGC